MDEKQYAWSEDEDWGYVSYRLNSIEECFADAIGTRLSPGDDIWIGEVAEKEIEYYFDADDFVGDICWDNDLEGDAISEEEIRKLDFMVGEVIDDWLDGLDVGENHFNVVNAKKYIIPEVNR